jgi:DNA polymerase III subunit delta'
MHSITTFPPYPWLQELWQQLQTLRRSEQLPHAILFAGPEGVGKFELAQAFAWSLLCKSPSDSGKPCSQCSGCNLLLAGNHPDYKVIEPEEDGKAIKIDAIREFIEKENITAHAGGYKPVLIRPADAMNQAAANSLLKTLEEPVSGTIMILISANPSRLPATIRSRCRLITIPVPGAEIATAWLKSIVQEGDAETLLKSVAGSPLKAVQMSSQNRQKQHQEMLDDFLAVVSQKKDPITTAGTWLKHDQKEILHWMCGWVIDMLRLQMVAEPSTLINQEQKHVLLGAAKATDTKRLYEALGHIYDARSNIDATLNSQMVLERLLLALVKSRRG